MPHMDRATLANIELEYETRGSGECIVFVHHGAGSRARGNISRADASARHPAYARRRSSAPGHPAFSRGVGENSDFRFHQRQELLLNWLPNIEPFRLPNAGHPLHLDNSHELAGSLRTFFTRHSIGASV
jgi:hypothetical protein